MLIKLPVSELPNHNAGRSAAFIDAVLAAGKIENGMIMIEVATWQRLSIEHRLRSTSQIGLGDLVHAVAHPIAKALDHVAGTNLANCGSCAERREFLNNLTK